MLQPLARRIDLTYKSTKYYFSYVIVVAGGISHFCEGLQTFLFAASLHHFFFLLMFTRAVPRWFGLARLFGKQELGLI